MDHDVHIEATLSSEQRRKLVADVHSLLRRLDADIAAKNPAPVCQSSGRCCKFEEYGHRLYVTTAELFHFADTLEGAEGAEQIGFEKPVSKRVPLPQFFAQPVQVGCPYQVNNLCTAREARPLGCRIYFCDSTAQSWQNEIYETYHHRLRLLHEEYDIPYSYMEWRAALRQILPSAD